MLITKYLQSSPHFFNSLRINKVVEITIVSPTIYPYLFVSLKSFNSGVRLNAFERLTVQFKSYLTMIFISTREVSKDEQ